MVFSMRKTLSSFLICLLLLTSLETVFHHHEDGADHPDCSICLALHHQADATHVFPTHHFLLRTVVATVYTQPVVTVVDKQFFTPANNRAPPV